MVPSQRIKYEITYGKALGDEIFELISRTKNQQLLHREVLDILGNHDTVIQKIDELLYNNKILKIPVELGNVKDFVLLIPKKENTGWLTMLCPCFTCIHITECEINNPVTPVSCKTFNEWLCEEDSSATIKLFKLDDYELLDPEEENVIERY